MASSRGKVSLERALRVLRGFRIFRRRFLPDERFGFGRCLNLSPCVVGREVGHCVFGLSGIEVCAFADEGWAGSVPACVVFRLTGSAYCA